MSLMLGEIELARRHTRLEYPEVASLLAQLEYDIAIRNNSELKNDFDKAIFSVTNALSTAQESSDTKRSQLVDIPIKCPFAGEIYICSAWRLASEIGYMGLNRAMIIGDLALAREQLVRFDKDLDNLSRELRHFVQNSPGAALTDKWRALTQRAAKVIESNLSTFIANYTQDLSTWLATPCTRQ